MNRGPDGYGQFEPHLNGNSQNDLFKPSYVFRHQKPAKSDVQA